jgi:hypothetical protein
MKFADRTVTLLLASLLTACAPELGAYDDADDSDTLDSATAALGSGVAELHTRIDGLTVWLDAGAHAETRDGRRVWVVGGRASRDLDAVFSFVPDDAYASAKVISARRFEVVLEDGSEINTLLSGLPLFVNVTPKSGVAATAAFWMAPRFTGFTGAEKLFVEEAIRPVWVAGELVYRARAHANAPYAQLDVATPAPPAIVTEGVRRWKLDWSFDQMIQAVAKPVAFTATSAAGASVGKRAALDFEVNRLELTRDDPYQVWAESCEPAVKACLAALPAGQLDTERCGSYRQVLYCGGLARE